MNPMANDDPATAGLADDGPFTLAIDIGGSHLKASLLDRDGAIIRGPVRIDTPRSATPQAVLEGLRGLAGELPGFDRVSVGFPGVVRHGRTLTAANLDPAAWRNFPLAVMLRQSLDRPVRVLNDAEVQGLGVISGRGVECVVTLGTGMGFALFQDGRLGPHLELAHHRLRKRATYEDAVGNAALESAGRRKWNRKVRRAIASIQQLVMYDMLYLGGGNAKHLDRDLPPQVRIVDNAAGMTGGIRLWDPIMDPLFTAG